jgi:hypothetical protein
MSDRDDVGIDLEDPAEIEEGIVRSAGLSSGVVAGEHEHVGHVLMADYDGGTADMLEIRDETDLTGINALLRSSPGSYHYYNLSVRPLDDQLVTALRLHGDPQHVASSARRGYFVLRWTGKVRQDGERYKEPPELVDVWTVDHPRDEWEPQSRPHVEALRRRALEDGLDDVADELESLLEAEEIDMVGDRAILSKYQTMTDDLKESVREDR